MNKEYILTGSIPAKKNQKRIIRTKTGRSLILPSEAHEVWHKDAVAQLREQGLIAFTKPVFIMVKMTTGDRRSFDISNKFESIADLLVDCGVLKDDNVTYMPEIHLQYDGYSKGVWKTEVYIEQILTIPNSTAIVQM